MAEPRLRDEDYHRLLELRTGLRRFLRWSEEQAVQAGVTPAQHQLLLAVRGHDDPRGPTVADIAHSLLLQHHSTVELVDRAQAVGLVRRTADSLDRRTVRVRLTPHGARRLAALAAEHVEELARLGPRMRALWLGLDRGPG